MVRALFATAFLLSSTWSPATESAGFMTEVSYFVDGSGSLSIDAVAAQPDAAFLPLIKETFSVTRDVYWLRFKIAAKTSSTTEAFVELLYPSLDFVDAYIPSPIGWRHYSTGDERLFANRPIANPNFLFAVSLPASGQAPSLRSCLFPKVSIESIVKHSKFAALNNRSGESLAITAR